MKHIIVANHAHGRSYFTLQNGKPYFGNRRLAKIFDTSQKAEEQLEKLYVELPSEYINQYCDFYVMQHEETNESIA